MLISLDACGPGCPGWPAASTAPAAPSLHRVRSFGMAALGNHQTESAELPSRYSNEMHGEGQMLVPGCKHPGPHISCTVVIKLLPAPHTEGKQLLTCSIWVGAVGHQLLIDVLTFRQKERAAVQESDAPPAMRLYEALDVAVYPVYCSCEPAMSSVPLIREAYRISGTAVARLGHHCFRHGALCGPGTPSACPSVSEQYQGINFRNACHL